MTPFRIQVPDPELKDLYRRLRSTRYPDQLDGAGWDYGMSLDVLRRFVDHWSEHYDWRRREDYYNEYPQFLASGAGEQVHFFHLRSEHAGAIPIVLLHGYMGSVAEFRSMMGPLVDPVQFGGRAEDAFHVVVPSLPGHCFSGPTRQRGFDMHRCADAIAEVMEKLGYEKYLVQGGDWGALIARRIAEVYADRLMGVHFNMLFAQPVPGEVPDMSAVTEAEQNRMSAAIERIADGTGYMSILSTRPQTVSVAHNDSPAGLAAWFLEKYQAWCDLERDDLESVFSLDQLIDNIMFYWMTGTTNSSARLYFESTRRGTSALDPWSGFVKVPTGHAVYPRELLQTPRAWAEKHYNIIYWSEVSRGGHFAPFEQSELFCEDLRRFARLLR